MKIYHQHSLTANADSLVKNANNGLKSRKDGQYCSPQIYWGLRLFSIR